MPFVFLRSMISRSDAFGRLISALGRYFLAFLLLEYVALFLQYLCVPERVVLYRSMAECQVLTFSNLFAIDTHQTEYVLGWGGSLPSPSSFCHPIFPMEHPWGNLCSEIEGNCGALSYLSSRNKSGMARPSNEQICAQLKRYYRKRK